MYFDRGGIIIIFEINLIKRDTFVSSFDRYLSSKYPFGDNDIPRVPSVKLNDSPAIVMLVASSSGPKALPRVLFTRHE